MSLFGEHWTILFPAVAPVLPPVRSLHFLRRVEASSVKYYASLLVIIDSSNRQIFDRPQQGPPFNFFMTYVKLHAGSSLSYS
jgi:hypothetical protein